MDKSAAQSAAGQAEQALCNARRGTALGDPGKDAGLFPAAGIPAQEEARAQDRSVCGLDRGGAQSGPERAQEAAPYGQTDLPAFGSGEGLPRGLHGGQGGGGRAARARRREVFVPLEHRPGEGQVDFGHALVKEAGQLRRRPFFAMSLPYSDAFFVQVFERECTESFWEGHLRAFEFFGAVPRRISYDNSKVAVGKIIGSRERKLTDGFLQLQSHYLFEEHFCLPARPNEKGVVEGIVRYARANFLVPVPQVRDLEELNAKLLEACERDMERKLRGKRAVKKELLAEERAVMLALPPIPFEASRKRSTCVSSLSLVRFECNDYSVPVRCAHHPVVVEGSCRQVVIFCGGQEVARHRRIWDKEQVSFEPVHYLALLEKKPGALDFARPLSGWQLPQCLQVLRRRLESQCGGEGTREYIRVLRLLEKHPMAALQQAVVSALRVGGLTREAIAQYLYPQEDYGSRTFRLDGHPHLRHVRVAAPDLGAYSELLKIPGGAL